MWSISTHGWRGWLLWVQPDWLMENTEEWNCTFECCRLKDWAWSAHGCSNRLSALSLGARICKRLINFSCHRRKEIPPTEDQWEKAAHEGVHRQAAAVGHLEDGERVLRVCAGAVPVRQGARCQRKGRGALSAGSKLLLRENLPQELMWWGGRSGTNGDGLTGRRSGERSASDWAIRLRHCLCLLTGPEVHICVEDRSLPPASASTSVATAGPSLNPGNRFESDPENDFYWFCTVWLRSIVFYLFSIVFCK